MAQNCHWLDKEHYTFKSVVVYVQPFLSLLLFGFCVFLWNRISYVAQTGLKLMIFLTLNLNLLSAGIIGVHHHTYHVVVTFNENKVLCDTSDFLVLNSYVFKY
jgi:hypothetical protein